MTTIAKGREVVTLINVFTVEPDTQQQMVDLLVEATETVINRLPGFVSANIHKSLDGTRVANYAQWRSREAFACGDDHRVHRADLGDRRIRVQARVVGVRYIRDGVALLPERRTRSSPLASARCGLLSPLARGHVSLE